MQLTKLSVVGTTMASKASVVTSPFHSEILLLICSLVTDMGSLHRGSPPAVKRRGESECFIF